MAWIRDRALTLALMVMFLLFLAGQLITGFAEYNSEQAQHGHAAVAMTGYLATGHPWEAIFENWESEFLQMARVRAVDDVSDSEGVTRIATTGGHGTRSTPILVTSPTLQTRRGRSGAAAGSCDCMSIRSAWRSCSSS